MKISEAQKWVKNAWKQSLKKGVQEKDEILFLLEELGEVAKAVRTINGYKNGKDTKNDLEKEFGDVLLSLITLAIRYDVDLESGFIQCIESAKKRYVKKEK